MAPISRLAMLTHDTGSHHDTQHPAGRQAITLSLATHDLVRQTDVSIQSFLQFSLAEQNKIKPTKSLMILNMTVTLFLLSSTKPALFNFCFTVGVTFLKLLATRAENRTAFFIRTICKPESI